MEKKICVFRGKMEPLAWNILPFGIAVFAFKGLVELTKTGPVAGCLMMFMIVACSAGIGLRMLFGHIKKSILKKNGFLVQGTITELERIVYKDHGYGRIFTVKCVYENPYTGIRHVGKNENYTYWYEDLIEVGQSVDVYVDRKNFKSYYVDIIGTIEKGWDRNEVKRNI